MPPSLVSVIKGIKVGEIIASRVESSQELHHLTTELYFSKVSVKLYFRNAALSKSIRLEVEASLYINYFVQFLVIVLFYTRPSSGSRLVRPDWSLNDSPLVRPLNQKFQHHASSESKLSLHVQSFPGTCLGYLLRNKSLETNQQKAYCSEILS